MKRVLLTIAAAFSLVACDNTTESGTIHISGTINGGDLAYVSVLLGDSANMVDTIDISSGTFEADIPATNRMDVFAMQFPGQRSLRFAGKNGDQLTFDIDFTDELISYSVEGNDPSKNLQLQQTIMKESITVLDSLDALNVAYQDSSNYAEVRQQLNQKFQETLIKHREALREMIVADTTDVTNIFAFYHQLGRTNILSAQSDWDLFLALDNGLMSKNPDHPMTMAFHRGVNQVREAIERSEQVEAAKMSIREGSLAPSIVMQDPFGEERSLSDLRGKVVLIDFWAAWCRPCRINNPHLVSMYEKYNDSGFEIFSVSLDGIPNQSVPREEWRAAIQQDGLVWPNHVSDLQGWNSPIVAQYGIEGIPFTVLIDQNGYIVGTNLRGQALEQKLESIFNPGA